MNTELDTMLDLVADGRKSTRTRATELHALLLDAEQAQRPWVRQILLDATLAGLGSIIKRHMKAKCMVATRQRTTTTVIGIQRENASGDMEWQQVPMSEATFDELRQYQLMLKANAATLRKNTRLIDRLLELESRAPSAATVGEAIAQLDTTVETVIGAAA